jgi:hypothetical protein
MFNKTQLLSSLETETKVIKHLWSKIPADKADFAPAPKMRTTLELLQYLTYCGCGTTKVLVNNSWDLIGAYKEQASALTWDQIPEALDRQLAEIKTMLSELTEDKLLYDERTMPWGTTAKLGQFMVDMPLKFMTAYRMQLFVYAKASGLTDLNTGNCWLGADMPVPPKN